MSNKSKIVLYGILVLILFFGGLVAGYYVWGLADGEKPDYPSLLKDAARYVATLETRQNELETQLKSVAIVTPTTGDSETPAEAATSETPAEGAVDERTKSLEMRLESLQEENAALQTALSSDKTAAEKNLELTDRIQALIQAKNTMEQENSTLRTQIGQAQDQSSENEQLKALIASLTDDKTRLEKENAELQTSGSEKNQLIAENRELAMQAQICANEKAELEKENTALQSASDRNQDLEAENQKLKTTLASNAEEIHTLKLRLDEIRAMANMQEKSGAQSPAAESGKTP